MFETKKLALAVGLLLGLPIVAMSKGPERPILDEITARQLFDAVTKKQPAFNTVTYNGVPMALGEDVVRPNGIVSVRWLGNGSTDSTGKPVVTMPTDIQVEAQQPRTLPLRYRILGPLAPKPIYNARFTVYPDGTTSSVMAYTEGLGPLLKETWSASWLSRLEARVTSRLILEGLMKVLARK